MSSVIQKIAKPTPSKNYENLIKAAAKENIGLLPGLKPEVRQKVKDMFIRETNKIVKGDNWGRIVKMNVQHGQQKVICVFLSITSERSRYENSSQDELEKTSYGSIMKQVFDSQKNSMSTVSIKTSDGVFKFIDDDKYTEIFIINAARSVLNAYVRDLKTKFSVN